MLFMAHLLVCAKGPAICVRQSGSSPYPRVPRQFYVKRRIYSRSRLLFPQRRKGPRKLTCCKSNTELNRRVWNVCAVWVPAHGDPVCIHETLARRRRNDGPASRTLVRHCASAGPTPLCATGIMHCVHGFPLVVSRARLRIELTASFVWGVQGHSQLSLSGSSVGPGRLSVRTEHGSYVQSWARILGLGLSVWSDFVFTSPQIPPQCRPIQKYCYANFEAKALLQSEYSSLCRPIYLFSLPVQRLLKFARPFCQDLFYRDPASFVRDTLIKGTQA